VQGAALPVAGGEFEHVAEGCGGDVLYGCLRELATPYALARSEAPEPYRREPGLSEASDSLKFGHQGQSFSAWPMLIGPTLKGKRKPIPCRFRNRFHDWRQ
jgi:hypothetical protein